MTNVNKIEFAAAVPAVAGTEHHHALWSRHVVLSSADQRYSRALPMS